MLSMARTIRRKASRVSEGHNSYKILRSFFGGCWWRFDLEDLPPAVLEYHEKRRKALWYSDKQGPTMYRGNVPASFRRTCNRHYRTKCQCVTRSINKGNYEGYSYPVLKRDAGYDYW
jgi:hypothetical protein